MLKPNKIIDSQRTFLEKKLNEIHLSQSEIKSIKKDKTKEIVTDKILGSFQIGKIVQTLLNWNEDVNKEINKKKEEILLSNLLTTVDENDFKLNRIVELLSNPYGLTIVGKIFNILYDSPPDENLINHLSSILKNIVKSDFELLFNQHKHFINIVDKLSPQSLSLLLDYDNWPDIPKGSGPYSISVGSIQTPWTKNFTKGYMKKNNLDFNDSSLANMINYSVLSLVSNNLIEGRSDNDGLGARITETGAELLEYLK